MQINELKGKIQEFLTKKSNINRLDRLGSKIGKFMRKELRFVVSDEEIVEAMNSSILGEIFYRNENQKEVEDTLGKSLTKRYLKLIQEFHCNLNKALLMADDAPATVVEVAAWLDKVGTFTSDPDELERPCSIKKFRDKYCMAYIRDEVEVDITRSGKTIIGVVPEDLMLNFLTTYYYGK